jgi:predicted acetyltransferase
VWARTDAYNTLVVASLDMTTYGPVPAEHRDDYRRILSQAFELGDGRHAGDEGTDEEWSPTLFGPRGLFDGEELVSVCKQYHLDARLHGEYVTMGGVGAVATPPEYRRQGHTRQLLTELLTEYHDAGVHLTALWPFSTPFYRDLGWAVANKFTEYELPPAQLRLGGEPTGKMVCLAPEDWDRLRSVEVPATAGTNLSLRRSEEWWHERTLAAWNSPTPPYIYGYERDGALCGYVIYTVRNTDSGRQLRVTDLLARDDEAYRALLGFLADHDSQVGSVLLRRSVETDLLDRVPNPDVVECTVKTGPMVRLTGVVDPLEAYPWPADLDVTWTLSVSDSLLAHSDGQFEVSVEEGDATVRPVEDAAGEPALTTDIGTLSQLFVGTHSLVDAERFGSLTIQRDSVRDPLAGAFDGTAVCLREFF